MRVKLADGEEAQEVQSFESVLNKRMNFQRQASVQFDQKLKIQLLDRDMNKQPSFKSS